MNGGQGASNSRPKARSWVWAAQEAAGPSGTMRVQCSWSQAQRRGWGSGARWPQLERGRQGWRSGERKPRTPGSPGVKPGGWILSAAWGPHPSEQGGRGSGVVDGSGRRHQDRCPGQTQQPSPAAQRAASRPPQAPTLSDTVQRCRPLCGAEAVGGRCVLGATEKRQPVAGLQ